MRVNAFVVAAAVLGGVGCGGLAQLAETTPVQVSARAPVEIPEPEPQPESHVQVTTGSIRVDQRINFAFNSAEIDSSSFGLLDELVAVLRDHEEIRRLRIEGHTDNVGGPGYNQDLSGRRAAAILSYFTEHGVDEGRLSSRGYGASQPRTSNETENGRAENRRVEFTILEREGASGGES